MLEQVFTVISIIVALLPIGVKVFSLIAQKTHNQRLINLSERATIIVTALEQQNITNEDKKDKALHKLAMYASETGIPVTGDQLDDYIESAVKLLKVLTSK